MTKITVTDGAGKTLLETDLPVEGLGKYLRQPAVLRATSSLGRVLAAPLARASGERNLDLAVDADVPIGRDGVELTVGAGAKAGMAVRQAGEDILPGSGLQAAAKVPNGTTYLAWTVDANLEASLEGKSGALAFGFRAGTSIRYVYAAPFDTAGSNPSVGQAVADLLASAVFPADAADLARLPVGAQVSVSGEGELSFEAAATLSATTNLLATPGLPLVGTAVVTQAASVSMKAAWSASGELELRVSRPSAQTVRLAFHRLRGRSLTVSARANAGLTAKVKDSELIAALMGAVSPNPEADILSLVDAGLSDAQIEGLQKAIEASINRSLSVSAEFEFSSKSDTESLFAYDITLDRLDPAGRAAVADALHGRLTAIGKLAGEADGPVRLVDSAEQRLRERRTTWRLNLLGIVNVASVTELIRKGSQHFDPVAGTFIAADRVSARRIRVKARPVEADAGKLRKVLLESLMATAACQSSRALGATVALTAEYTFVDQRGKARRDDLDRDYRALIGLGLCDEAERARRIDAIPEFGTTTFMLANAFSPAACDAMFLDTAGEPFAQEHYETIGRRAFLALLPERDAAAAPRRLALASDATWAEVRQLGGAIASALPSHVAESPALLEVAAGDVYTIVWWASAMHAAARALSEMRGFLKGRDAAALAADRTFLRQRHKLEKALAAVAANSSARFDDPWDALALDAAASGLGKLEAAVISARFAARYTDEKTKLPSTPASRAIRGRGGPAPEAAVRGGRPWTAGELDVFNRHVINLRRGALSTDGTFQSSKAQLQRMFGELIPDYAATAEAKGQQPAVIFIAHGGLTDEREGLTHALAQHRFFLLNGVYPVYFVWETGLKETLSDIIGQALAIRGAERGRISDALIERLARAPGTRIWDEMKQSAAAGAAPGGGSRLTADLAAELWRARKGAIEFHALGHSAGAIFHAHFLPLLVGRKPAGTPPPAVATLHFLAPAVTTALFKKQLMTLAGSGRPVGELATYTMRQELELVDPSMPPYGHSLLCLVSRAFEDTVGEPLLGLDESLKRDSTLIRFFGIRGTSKVADIVFSRTDPAAPLRMRSQSTTHGGFDNDPDTMTSVVRRVLNVPDTTAVVDYFEDDVDDRRRPATRSVSGRRPPAAAALRSAPAVRTTGRKAWTFMVWMAGDNDLETYGDRDLREMKRVGSTDEVNVVVQFDSMRDDHTRRYFMRPGGAVGDDVVQEIGETNTGDPAVATDFFRWAIDRYPADRLLGVIWNHGSGIDETDVYRGVRGGAPPRFVRAALSGRHRRALFQSTVAAASRDRGIAYDDSARDFLDNLELKQVLVNVKKATGRPLDVLGFDACLMSMVEIAYQLRGTARTVVGSEEVEPGDGWPYDRILQALAGTPSMTAAELAATVVSNFVASYRSGDVTQAAVDLSRLDTTAKAVDHLATALIKAIRAPVEYAAVTKALNAAQRFDMPDYVDLGHVCAELAARSKAAAVKAAAKDVIDALRGRTTPFVLAEAHKGTGVKQATGVAIYFPRGRVNATYARLDFAKVTSWRKFLLAYQG